MTATTVGSEVLRWRNAAGIPVDGGTHKRVDWIEIGGVPLPIVNIDARRRALLYHDQGHVLSGYGTDWRGEMEESAFEIAMGCGPLWFAWLINLQGFAFGMVTMPARTLAAWRRGARTRDSLYHHPDDTLLGLSVSDARARLGVPDGPAPWAPGDSARLAGHVAAGFAVGWLPVLAVLGAIAAAAVAAAG